MQIQFKNTTIWRALAIGCLSLFLFVAYFWWNPTSMTNKRIKLRMSCLTRMPDNVYDLVQDKLDSFDMARQECRIVYPLIGQIFEFEASSRTLLYSHPGFKERV